MSVALGVRSDFSIGESLLQLDHLVEACKTAGYDAVALADTMTISALPDFAAKTKKAGLKPIIGCRLRVYDRPTDKTTARSVEAMNRANPMFMPKVYVMNENGLRSLFGMLTLAYQEDHFYYVPRIGFEELLELEDCIITTGDLHSLWHQKDASLKLARLLDKFGWGRVYSEIVPVNTPLFDKLNRLAVQGAADQLVPVVASYPFLYKGDDAPTLEVLQAICSNTQMASAPRPRQFVKDFVVEPQEALRARMLGWGIRALPTFTKEQVARTIFQALSNQRAIAQHCTYEYKKMPICLPKMAADENAELLRKVKDGWDRRLRAPVLGYLPPDLTPYLERVYYEMDVLQKLGFSGYFLLVEDLVNWAKSNGIMVGPGRGSVGGSLVAYLIGITDVDPLRFSLLFERFINPERLDLPDADLDFMSSRRHEVVEYLTAKYGEDKVAGISNYATLASGSALRDTGRVHGLQPVELSATKLVPKPHGQPMALNDAADAVAELDRFRREKPDLWAHALKLEGAMRSFGQHAAGVVVAGEPLVKRAVIESRSEGRVVNWDRNSVESFGLVKMDVLGLSTLDVLKAAKEIIEDRHGGLTIDFLKLPLDDEKVLEAFGRGETVGVFQFESPGMRKLLKDLALGGPLTFDDIVATTALYRPGPMDAGLMDDYVSIRQGYKPVFYEHPSMEAALAPTHGVIIYQEQVMQLARDLAGFSMAGADHLRKAMGKKDKEKMAEMRGKWVDGCKTHSGMDERQAGELFDKIEAFAGYGFNKSHAVEYTIISFWAMYLKVHYAQEFYAAALTVADTEDKLRPLVADAKKHGLEIWPPDINESGMRYHISGGRLLAPFHAVKGISENIARHVVEAQKKAGRRFTSRADFEDHVHKGKCNVKARDSLDKVGAFAHIEPGQPGPKDPVRLKDQMELLPGIILETPKADRSTSVGDTHTRAKIIQVMTDYRDCKDCPLSEQPHPQVQVGRTAVRYAIVFDAPGYKEGKAGKLMTGDIGVLMKEALKEAGVDPQEGYYTALVKGVKRKDEKFLPKEALTGCPKFLDRELAIIKPPVIVTMGGNATRHFLPDLKSPAEAIGRAYFDAARDATIVVGFHPAQALFDRDKEKQILEVAKALRNCLL